MVDEHSCFVQRKPLKQKLQKLTFFDFEIDQSSSKHVVNFLHAQCFVPDAQALEEEDKSKNSKAKSRFSYGSPDHKHLSNHENWKEEWCEVSFKGRETLKEFLMFLIQDKERFNGYMVIPHNFWDFDGIFILRELLEKVVMPGIIVRGQKIMLLTIKKCNMQFIDSLTSYRWAL